LIYFIRMTGTEFIKIGFTSRQPEKRLAELQTAAPSALELLCTLPGDETIESELHRRFWQYKTDGGDEWFKIPTNILTEEIQKYVIQPENQCSFIRTSPYDHGSIPRRQFNNPANGGKVIPGFSTAFDHAVNQPLFSSMQRKR
jgi:hypothetical protein